MRKLFRIAAVWQFMDVWKERPADTKPIYAIRNRGRWMRRVLTRIEKYKNERRQE